MSYSLSHQSFCYCGTTYSPTALVNRASSKIKEENFYQKWLLRSFWHIYEHKFWKSLFNPLITLWVNKLDINRRRCDYLVIYRRLENSQEAGKLSNKLFWEPDLNLLNFNHSFITYSHNLLYRMLQRKWPCRMPQNKNGNTFFFLTSWRLHQKVGRSVQTSFEIPEIN